MVTSNLVKIWLPKKFSDYISSQWRYTIENFFGSQISTRLTVCNKLSTYWNFNSSLVFEIYLNEFDYKI